MAHIREELALRFPKLCARASTSRAAAVKLFCVECMGGVVRDARECEEAGCPLRPHRGSGWSGYVDRRTPEQIAAHLAAGQRLKGQ